jgi:hypothetical protein
MNNKEKNPLVSVFLNRFISSTGAETYPGTTKQQIVNCLEQFGFNPHNSEVNNTLVFKNPNPNQILNQLQLLLEKNQTLAVRITNLDEITKTEGLNTYNIANESNLKPIANLDFSSLAMVEIFSRIKTVKHNQIDLGGGFRLNIVGLRNTTEKHELAKLVYSAEFGFNNCLPRDLEKINVPKVRFNFSLPIMEEPFLLPPKLVIEHQKNRELKKNTSDLSIAKLSLSSLLFDYYHQIKNTSLALLVNYPSLSGANGFEGQWALLEDQKQIGNFRSVATIYDIESYWSMQTFSGQKSLPTDTSITNFSRDSKKISDSPIWKSLQSEIQSRFEANQGQNERLLIRHSILSGC